MSEQEVIDTSVTETASEGNAELDESEAKVKFTDIVHIPWLKAALEKNGFVEPTPVQADSLPYVLKGQDVVLQAETGSGKTLTFCLPLLVHVKAAACSDTTRALVVCPTRELALQVVSVLESLSDEVSPCCLIGGMSMKKQFQQLEDDPTIVVGTPGRILDLIKRKRLSLRDCSFFALDEADEMLSMGFMEDVEKVLQRLPQHRQGLFCSATISPRVKMLASRFLSRPHSITVERLVHTESEGVDHYVSVVGAGLMDKPRGLMEIIEHFKPRSAVVFCNTKSDTELVEAILKRQNYDAERINSDLTQSQRNKIMEQLREDRLSLLIATDVAARGLDIDHIDLVVNYSVPDQPESYVHRTGRTGRAGRSGVAATVIAPMDKPRFHLLQKELSISFLNFPEQAGEAAQTDATE